MSQSSNQIKSFLRSTSVFTGLAAAVCVVGLGTGNAQAQVSSTELPTGESIAAGNGSATFSRSGRFFPRLNINQTSDRVIIDWNTFNIGRRATTNFIQPGKNSVALNRVSSGSPTQILGRLNANGNVVIQNQNGVFFGSTARVDVQGLVATTGRVNERRFLRGDANLRITDIGEGGEVVNNGLINIKSGGLGAFVAPTVRNNGVILARLGRVALASGDRATVDLYGDGLVSLAVQDGISNALIENNGTIEANGGVVALSVAAAEGVVDSAINMNGVIRANTAERVDGKIILSGSGDVKTTVTGDIIARDSFGKGGTVEVSGQEVELTSTADIDVSGTGGGGEIFIGGGQGGRGSLREADEVIIREGAELLANGEIFIPFVGRVGFGDGGLINLWSKNLTQFDGEASVRGGRFAGNGGFIETSSNTIVQILQNALLDATALSGENGSWLIDPTDTSIRDTSSGTLVGSVIDSVVLSNTLDSGTDTTIRTAAGGSDDGNVSVDADVVWNGEGSLTIDADHDVILNRSIESGFAGGDGSQGAITLLAGNDIEGDDIIGNRNVTTNGGDITMRADDDINLGGRSGTLTVSSVDGDISFRADDNINVENRNFRSNSRTEIRSTNGDISFRADNDVNFSAGNFFNSGLVVEATNGELSVRADDDVRLARDPSFFNSVSLRGQTVDVRADDEVTLGTNSELRSLGGNLTVRADDDNNSDGFIRLSSFSQIVGGADANVTLNSHGVGIFGGAIRGNGGNVNINNRGVFFSLFDDSVSNTDDGNITIQQNAGGSIQNVIDAIDRSNTTGTVTVRVNDGTYNENLDIDKALRLRALNGASQTVINGSGFGGSTIAILADGVQIGSGNENHGFTINTGTFQSRAIGLFNGADDILVENNDIEVGNFQAGLVGFGGNDDVTVRGNNFSTEDGEEAIAFVAADNAFGASDNWNITNNTFTGDALLGVASEATGSRIRGNSFTGQNRIATVRLREATRGGNGGHNNFNNNTFNTQNPVHILLQGNATSMTPENFIDNNNFPVGYVLVDGPTVNSDEGVFGLIQGGVDHAADGATVKASAHTFVEQVVVDAKNITIKGAGKGETVVAAPEELVQTSEDGANNNFAIIQVKNAENVVIEDLTVDGSTNEDTFFDNNNRFVGIGYDEAGGTVQNVHVKDIATDGNTSRSGFGILARSIAENTLDVVETMVTGFQKFGVFVSGRGLDGMIDDNMIEGAPDNGVNKVGIRVSGRASNDVTENNISKVQRGIVVRNVQGSEEDAVEVSGNTIDASRVGIRGVNSEGLAIQGNTITDTNIWGRIGIHSVNVSDSVINGMNSVDGFRQGIVLEGNSNVEVSENTLMNVVISGISDFFSDMLTIDDNSIMGTGVGIELTGTSNSTVSNHELDGFDTGVVLHSVTDVTLQENMISNSETGLMVEGNQNGLITLLDNTFTENETAGFFQNGQIAFEGVNTFTGGTTGLVFDPGAPVEDDAGEGELQFQVFDVLAEPTPFEIVGNTFGTSVFEGQSGNYIELFNGAFFEPGTPTVLDATSVTFDGIQGPVLNSVERLFIEGKILDFLDNGSTALIFAGIEPGAADEDDILRLLNGASFIGPNGPLLTVNGLPFLPDGTGGIPAGFLASLGTQAGEDGELTPEQLNELGTAAGGEEVNCWGDLFGAFSGGTTASVNFNFDTDPASLLQSQATCGSAL